MHFYKQLKFCKNSGRSSAYLLVINSWLAFLTSNARGGWQEVLVTPGKKKQWGFAQWVTNAKIEQSPWGKKVH